MCVRLWPATMRALKGVVAFGRPPAGPARRAAPTPGLARAGY